MKRFPRNLDCSLPLIIYSNIYLLRLSIPYTSCNDWTKIIRAALTTRRVEKAREIRSRVERQRREKPQRKIAGNSEYLSPNENEKRFVVDRESIKRRQLPAGRTGQGQGRAGQGKAGQGKTGVTIRSLYRAIH